ncbi:MAG: thioredoxin domain-containing protein [bacterium]
MSDEQNNQEEKKSKCQCDSSSKLMVLFGILLGIAIISTVAFFILLFRSTANVIPSAKIEEGDVKGETVKQEEDVKPEETKQNTVDLTKLDIIADDHIKGDKNAPVTVVLYDDMECPFCGAFEGTNKDVMEMLKQRSPGWEPVMTNLIKDYINHGKVKIVYRHFPLSFHQNAFPAAEASECAGVQGKFWEMHDKIFAINGKELSAEKFKQMARDLKLDMDKYNGCIDNHEMKNKVMNDMQSGQALGVEGTPAAFINGQVLSGAVPYDSFRQVVEEELN